MNRKLTATSIAAALAPFTATPVFAQGEPNPGGLLIPTEVTEFFSITSIGEFVGAILSLLFIVAGILVFVYIVWGGLQWITSGGDQSQVDAARGRITAALTGIAIIALSYAIVVLVEYFFGITIISDGGAIPQPWGNVTGGN